jgi:hypothetical protein
LSHCSSQTAQEIYNIVADSKSRDNTTEELARKIVQSLEKLAEKRSIELNERYLEDLMIDGSLPVLTSP